ncbi:hypothetical protein BKA83DRAFT_4129130 [Pisolithus microcarpus]|nr:hypothetical protein BKA83DRAFT_4129130 [Pisolithus microcarpus]
MSWHMLSTIIGFLIFMVSAHMGNVTWQACLATPALSPKDISSVVPWWMDQSPHADISNFHVEEIHGPVEFSCKTGCGCHFQEPVMNQLINNIFGDAYIMLNCEDAPSSGAAGLIYILALDGAFGLFIGYLVINSINSGH